MGMQELGAELDEQAWAVGNARTKNLDTEVLGLEQQAPSQSGQCTALTLSAS
jgi:hypothetical protein